ncbi:MAG: TonB-dependent receptor domain-containing protein, partial [Gammaproteobacteria bacterium]
GLGLAKIRDGDLDAGTREIETAASLDPNNSLVRSYLGKAYYEQKRDGLASSEYEQAKLLDPKDPTPWFYDAIHKQATNRPVEALHDLQRAIELNDNRAVYRSKLLLDQDLAARSAALGRIYRDLGFEQLALVEGWKSVNTDPSDYSAHRLLADSYSGLQRHEIARVSELLQSQLLQPINLTPVQPNLGESNLLILEGSGPSDAAFNEFNPMFARNRLALQPSAIFGGNDTVGEEVTHSGLWGRFSYSLGQFHYETEGFRENNDLEHDVYNAFAQISVSPNMSVQGEFRYEDTESGDLRLRFDPEAFLPNQRLEVVRESARLGVKYSPTVGDTVVVSLVHLDSERQRSDSAETIEPLMPGIDVQTIDEEFAVTETEAYTIEAQYLSDFKRSHFIFGMGYFDQERKDRVTESKIINALAPSLSPDPILVMRDFDTQFIDLDTQHINAYTYTDIEISPALTWIMGLSLDAFDSPIIKRARVNPKFGAIWRVSPLTTLRAAGFKTVKRPFASNQTIEPTQVAGFNQFFDDIDGSDAKRYGLALDQRINSSMFVGLEASWRDLETPILVNETGSRIFEEQEERFHRGYLYWTPVPSLALSAEYLFEDIEKQIPASEPDTITTHRAPLTLRYHHPSGLFMRIGSTYVNQDVATVEVEGDDRFWVTDISVGYRLPKRWGITEAGAKNLFDEEFDFHDINFNTGEPVMPLFLPDRLLFVQVSLAF